MTFRYLSVCSGIEAATVAWHPLGWEAAAFSEIEAFPRAVLSHHYPAVPLHGDFTTIRGDEYGAIDLLVGGTPCQDFSVAGLRAGIAGDRGNLTLEFLRLAARVAPRWIVWENVPGVLSSDGGRALGAFLGGLAQLGYGFAYRVLDAQYFGLAQRRQRVFVVGYLGDWRRAAAVLFERESLQGHPAPRREKGKAVAATIGTRVAGGSLDLFDQIAAVHSACDGGLIAKPWPADVAPTLNAAFSAKDHGADAGEIAPTFRSGSHRNSHANGGVMPAVAFHQDASGEVRIGDSAYTLNTNSNASGRNTGMVQTAAAVRRLTPRECERLQGFPEIHREVTIRVCASEEERRALASSAALGSLAQKHAQSGPVAAHVLIDLERQQVQILKAGKSIWFANGAERPSASPLSTPPADFAHLVAAMTTIAVPQILGGKAASPLNTNDFSHRWSGSAFVPVSGCEIRELAKNVGKLTAAQRQCFTSITSGHGQHSQSGASTLEILSCCVVAAIGSCIRERMQRGSSFNVTVETHGGYTFVPYRNKAAADGPRYKALGNSMAVPVMAWIGERIAMVERIK